MAFALILVPVALSVPSGDFAQNAWLAEDRTKLERRAEEVLSQEELAPSAGPPGWRPRTCPTSPASSWAASTRRAPA